MPDVKRYPAPGRRVRFLWDPIREGTVQRVILEQDGTVNLHVEWIIAWGCGGEDTFPASAFEPVDETGGRVEITITSDRHILKTQ